MSRASATPAWFAADTSGPSLDSGSAVGAASASDEVVLLRVRKGTPVPLRFVARPDGIYVMPSGPDARWSAAALRDGACEIDRGDGVQESVATELVADPHLADDLRAALRSKYGDRIWIRHFAHSDRVIRLWPASPAARVGSLDRARTEFDAAAPRYAAGVEANPIQRYLKHRSADLLTASFEGVDPLLEIGPGTGFETLPLLAAGHSIVAVDLSRGMLQELSRRAALLGLADRLTLIESDVGALGTALADRRDGSFAGAYSTFGALNLAPDVGRLGADLHRVVRPHGLLRFTTLNRPGLGPVVWDAIAGDRRGVRARMRSTIAAGDYKFPLDVHLRNPPFWDRVLGPWFARCETRAVSVLSPPFDSDRLTGAMGTRGRRRAAAMDDALSRLELLAPFGEWSMLTYRRTAAGGGD